MKKNIIVSILVIAFLLGCKNNKCNEESCNEVISNMTSSSYIGILYIDDFFGPTCDSLETMVDLTVNANTSDLISISLKTDQSEIDTVIIGEIKCNIDIDCVYTGMQFYEMTQDDNIAGAYYQENDSIYVTFLRPYSPCDNSPGWTPHYFLGIAN